MDSQSRPQVVADDNDEVSKGEDEDEELNALLESAFSDFQKQGECPGNDSTSSAAESSEELSRKEKQRKETQAEVEQFLKGFVDNDPQLKEQWNKLTECCQKAANAQNDEEFEESISETLKNLSENAKSLAENTDVSDEELSRIWRNLGDCGDHLGKGLENNSPFPEMIPLVTNMMQSLLSKEILHPALKDLTVKYPEWLDENKDNLNAEDLKRYTRQFELMKDICKEFDLESEEDTPAVKNERFQKVLAIMQEMQQCGAPPKDLVADGPEFGSDGEFDFSKIPGFPNSGEFPDKNCCIM